MQERAICRRFGGTPEAHVTTTRVRGAHILALVLSVLAWNGSLFAQAPKAPDTLAMPAANGDVTLSHKAHTASYGAKCDSCHHASKPDKPLKTAHQKCGDCHTKAVTAPMKTKLQAAFHDPMAKKGTCIDCHVQAAAKGNTKVPGKCKDCHKKA